MRNKYIQSLSIFIFIIFIYYLFYFINYKSPINYNLVINEGDTVLDISNKLQENNIINSGILFRAILNFRNKDNKLVYGVYTIPENYNIFSVINIISDRRNAKPIIYVTIPEGFDNIKIAERLAKISNINFNKELFLNIAKDYQGYLFPETYYFTSNIDERGIVLKMTKEFGNRIGQIDHNDLILASIIEGEAKYVEDMRIISGILKKRMRIGMRLQVDVANITYKEIGLPASPINNPGLNAVNAVKNPIETKYLYYLTGKDGKMYYSVDYDGHIRNINKYLR